MNRVEIDGQLTRIRIRVDGRLVSASAARLLLDAERVPVLQLDLPLDDAMIVTLRDTCVIPGDETRAALIAMGWTPPPGGGGEAASG
jgi:hypothetical protein